MLINDILDLSKIESGTVAVDVSELRLDDLHRSIERGFRHVAEAKHVDFVVQLEQPLPRVMVTDVKRLQQIIKNLLSNAFKFTHEGQVTFTISHVASGWSSDNEELNRASQVLAFSVADTGIGISADKQQIIFEAFQQADGSTSRKYGGTGLGLAISRELSRLLGGEIRLVSAPGQGSAFTLYLPQNYNPLRSPRHGRSVPSEPTEPLARADEQAMPPAPPVAPAAPYFETVTATEPPVVFANAADDDRDDIATGDRVMLIVENEIGFAKVLLDAARACGFKGLVTGTGARALTMTREFLPSVITLDIHLPDMEGWRILDRLKTDLVTRHIPICVVSTDDARDRALQAGAIGFVAKPLQSADEVHAALGAAGELCRSAGQAAGRRDAAVAVAHAAARGLGQRCRRGGRQQCRRSAAALADADCVVVDDTMPGFGPEDMLDALAKRSGVCQLPLVVYRAGRGTLPGVGSPARRVRPARGGLAGDAARASGVLAAPQPGRDVGPRSQRDRDRARRLARPARQEGADRRRRHAQHLRAGHRARRGRHGDRLGRQWPRCDPADRERSGDRHRADGHHDAGDGRPDHDAPDPRPAARA